MLPRMGPDAPGTTQGTTRAGCKRHLTFSKHQKRLNGGASVDGGGRACGESTEDVETLELASGGLKQACAVPQTR